MDFVSSEQNQSCFAQTINATIRDCRQTIQENKIMIKSATYLGLVVKDLAATTAYFRDTLGVRIDETQEMPGQVTQFALEGGAVLALQAGTDIPNQIFEPGILVEDVDATYAQWKANGAIMLDEPTDLPFGRAFMLQTPDGHVLRVFQQ